MAEMKIVLSKKLMRALEILPSVRSERRTIFFNSGRSHTTHRRM